MSAVMSWPSFSMNAAIQPQLLRLEDSFEEAHRARVTIQEEVKVAVVPTCISGQLRTHVSLQLAEGMGYKELRDCLLKWDRAQQRWGHLIPSSHDDTPTEVDRLEEKGKGKKQNKGKGKDKGKNKGKDGSQQKSKGKKSDGKGKGSWTYGKGKGQGQQGQSEVKCFRCNG